MYYANNMLDTAHCVKYDIQEASDVGFTPVFRMSVAITLVPTDLLLRTFISVVTFGTKLVQSEVTNKLNIEF
jgi:hypothetical protein